MVSVWSRFFFSVEFLRSTKNHAASESSTFRSRCNYVVLCGFYYIIGECILLYRFLHFEYIFNPKHLNFPHHLTPLFPSGSPNYITVAHHWLRILYLDT